MGGGNYQDHAESYKGFHTTFLFHSQTL